MPNDDGARGGVARRTRCHPRLLRRQTAARVTPTSVAGHRENGERATELGVLRQFLVATHGTETVVFLLQSRSHADAGPAADARIDADELLALVLVGEHVADDSGRRLELEQFLVDVLRIDALQVAFQRAEAGDAAGGVERAAPHRELLGLALHDLAGAGVPGDVAAHAAA